jgi:hypothetical protein
VTRPGSAGTQHQAWFVGVGVAVSVVLGVAIIGYAGNQEPITLEQLDEAEIRAVLGSI